MFCFRDWQGRPVVEDVSMQQASEREANPQVWPSEAIPNSFLYGHQMSGTSNVRYLKLNQNCPARCKPVTALGCLEQTNGYLASVPLVIPPVSILVQDQISLILDSTQEYIRIVNDRNTQSHHLSTYWHAWGYAGLQSWQSSVQGLHCSCQKTACVRYVDAV